MKIALIVLLPLLVFSRQAHGVEKPSVAYVPPVVGERVVSVEAGKDYRFPWLRQSEACVASRPGCFHLLSRSDVGVRIRFVSFVVNRGRVQRSGFIREVMVGPEATAEELFSIKDSPGPEETWVHAYYRSKPGQIVFFSRPAFVTDKAKIRRQILLDFQAQTMEEITHVQTETPLTLIASGAVEKALPGAERHEILVQGQKPHFRFSNLLDLNLPIGKTQVRTSFHWREFPKEICPWSLYEGKKMSLPTRTDLRLVGLNGKMRYHVRFGMFGIPDPIWRDFEPVLKTTPMPLRRVRREFSEYLTFTNAETIAISFKPVYFHRTGEGGATFPVLMCLRATR